VTDAIVQFNFWAIIDITIISFIIYNVILLIQGTRAAQMLTGILIVFGAFLFSSIVPLTTVNWVMNKFYSSFLLIVIVLFQDELRNALSKIGKNPLSNTEDQNTSSFKIIDELARASGSLAQTKTGALIVLERDIILKRYIEIGIPIDSLVTSELLQSIFHPSSPIHDGAVIIQNARITASGCFLPLTKSDTLALDMGTRHRAAVGISEETDAVVILVSEEKGNISIVHDGRIQQIASGDQLKKRLKKYFASELQSEKLEKMKREKGEESVIDKLGNLFKKNS
jgi:diadenylate cyclase